ncbi:hypothetical protein N7494_000276 [Penicillium frequentans]|uniref:Aminoglycoside phosphotransferase domain-containing protein n=1 Tax=Penicillium frequentans TaxID=3151616 RepID=A0AAD6D5V0_9EURO|nr:hypothetical protein N7494_000276 [Penicillium glabrum]
MGFDPIAWKRNGDVFSAWKNKLLGENISTEIERCIMTHTHGSTGKLSPPDGGAFNMVFRMKFSDTESAVMRLPKPGFCVFPEEKVKIEVAVMRFLQTHTNIPVPRVFHCGTIQESPGKLGPFVIMEYIKSDCNLADALKTPNLDDKRPILDPNISEGRLRSVYSEIAKVLLELAKHSFNEIGSMSNSGNDELVDDWTVTHRPLTMNMNRLVQLGNFPPHLLPQDTFKSASEYFLALAEMHMTHLYMQPKGAIVSAADCRRKYIARCLFRKLARENRLCRYDKGPFKLFCDDLRPSNILANSNDNFSISGAIDWEFSYAAPAEFVYTPPTWLVLERPEAWSQGLDDWAESFEKRLPIFLEELIKQETSAINHGSLSENDRIAERMKESWESGDFWVNYAARRSWAFDMVFWAKVDQRFFGQGSLEDRFDLLTSEERNQMGEFVQRKLAQMKETEST